MHRTRDDRQLVVASHWTLQRDAQASRSILEVNNDIPNANAPRRDRRLNLRSGAIGQMNTCWRFCRRRLDR